eukprot:58357-Rhodomonas_salina.5
MADNSAGAPQDQYEQIVVSSAIFRHTCSAMLSTDAVYRAPRTIFRFTRACTAEHFAPRLVTAHPLRAIPGEISLSGYTHAPRALALTVCIGLPECSIASEFRGGGITSKGPRPKKIFSCHISCRKKHPARKLVCHR